mmetsp:Transcript_5790/g.14757  ORF Transcript_5790/g.14757 Transcript_5790/m.14757 type:complete len:216 (-) Transcript_5790:580-1227(-)
MARSSMANLTRPSNCGSIVSIASMTSGTESSPSGARPSRTRPSRNSMGSSIAEVPRVTARKRCASFERRWRHRASRPKRMAAAQRWCSSMSAGSCARKSSCSAAALSSIAAGRSRSIRGPELPSYLACSKQTCSTWLSSSARSSVRCTISPRLACALEPRTPSATSRVPSRAGRWLWDTDCGRRSLGPPSQHTGGSFADSQACGAMWIGSSMLKP